MEEKKLTKYYRFLGVFCLAVLILFGVLHIAVKDRSYSSSEKRSLAGLPVFSMPALLDGSYMSGMEKYMSDQFPFRDTWMKAKTNLTLMTGNRESKGVLYMPDGTLIEAFQEPDQELLEKTASAVNTFIHTYSFENAYFLLSPTAAGVRADEIGERCKNADQMAYIDTFTGLLDANIRILDTAPAFSRINEAGEDIFYRTDHHWTTEAAQQVFLDSAEITGWNTADFELCTVSNRFSGSLVSKSGFSPNKLDAVSIPVCTDSALQILVNHSASHESSGTIYSYDALVSDNPYEVFFGGNEPLITIQTTADTERTLLVFKDSYANCFIPFLTESYKTIVIIDPRYYADTLSTMFVQSSFSDVLFLYNASTLSQDENLWMVLEE